MHDLVSIEVRSPLPRLEPRFGFRIDPKLTACSWSTALPGGFNGAQIGLDSQGRPATAYLPLTNSIDVFDDIIIRRGAAVRFHGRVARYTQVGPEVRAFECEGYGQALPGDQVVFTTGTVDELLPRTTGALLRLLLARYLPVLMIGPDYEDPGIGPHWLNQYGGQSLADVISAMSKETALSGDAGAWLWGVWENLEVMFARTRQPVTWPATVDNEAGPDYLCDFDPAYVQWVADTTDMASQVLLHYTSQDIQNGLLNPDASPGTPTDTGTVVVAPVNTDNGGGTGGTGGTGDGTGDGTGGGGGGTTDTTVLGVATAERWIATAADAQFIDSYGFNRVATVEGGQLWDVTAHQLAQFEATRRKVPQVAVTVTLQAGICLQRPSGGYAESDAVRAGEWLQVGNQPPVLILHTDHDDMAGQTTITGNAYGRGYYQQLLRLQAAVRYYERGLALASGAKLYPDQLIFTLPVTPPTGGGGGGGGGG